MSIEIKTEEERFFICLYDAEFGLAAPVPDFGTSGGATQYLFDKPIEQLLKDGILEVVR